MTIIIDGNRNFLLFQERKICAVHNSHDMSYRETQREH